MGATEATTAVQIAGLAATRPGLGDRTWPAEPSAVAHRLADAVPGEAVILTDGDGDALGWRVLYPDRSEVPGEFRAEIVVDPEADDTDLGRAVDGLVVAATRHGRGAGGESLVVVTGADQVGLAGALHAAGFVDERRFAVEHRRVTESVSDLRAAVREASDRGGFRIIDWEQTGQEKLSGAVRRLQHTTFREHWGNLSKSELEWEHYLAGPEFVGEFSAAAVDRGTGKVIGYVLGARSYTVNPVTSAIPGVESVSAHTEYIGVDRRQRRRGVAATLLRSVWASAASAGLTVASLGVDVENSSNAQHLYESLGYRPVGHHVAYRLSLGAGER